MAASEEERRHTIVALVDNEPGVLARVIGLFSGRGYNIESLTVAQVDKVRGLSRINIVTTGSEFVIEQIKSLLAKLVPVQRVQDLTAEGPHVERELALVKVIGDRERLIAALRLADFMHARLVDSMPGSFVFEVTGTSDELDAFIDLLEPVEVSRAGVVAIGRGDHHPRAGPGARLNRRRRSRETHHARLLRCRRRPEPDQGQEGRRGRLRQPGLRPRQQPQGQRRARGRRGAEARLGDAPEGRGRRHQVPDAGRGGASGPTSSWCWCRTSSRPTCTATSSGRT